LDNVAASEFAMLKLKRVHVLHVRQSCRKLRAGVFAESILAQTQANLQGRSDIQTYKGEQSHYQRAVERLQLAHEELEQGALGRKGDSCRREVEVSELGSVGC
jgi:hypothetical protein